MMGNKVFSGSQSDLLAGLSACWMTWVVEKGVGKADCRRRGDVCIKKLCLPLLHFLNSCGGCWAHHWHFVRACFQCQAQKRRQSVKPMAADTRNEVGRWVLVWAFCAQKCLGLHFSQHGDEMEMTNLLNHSEWCGSWDRQYQQETQNSHVIAKLVYLLLQGKASQLWFQQSHPALPNNGLT